VAELYGHADDLCDLMVAMAGVPASRGEIFNVTAGGVTSLRCVTTLAEIVGVEPDIVLNPDHVLPTISDPVSGHLFVCGITPSPASTRLRGCLASICRWDFTSPDRSRDW
jgi:nucleoside-diphosphate-sugar epimerase